MADLHELAQVGLVAATAVVVVVVVVVAVVVVVVVVVVFVVESSSLSTVTPHLCKLRMTVQIEVRPRARWPMPLRSVAPATSDMDSAPQKLEGPTLQFHRQVSQGDFATPVQTSASGSSLQSQVGTLPNSCERVCPLEDEWRALHCLTGPLQLQSPMHRLTAKLTLGNDFLKSITTRAFSDTTRGNLGSYTLSIIRN